MKTFESADRFYRTRSKFLSLVLRHKPEAAGVTLDSEGWVDVDKLLAGVAQAGRGLTRDELRTLVEKNDKQRFSFSPDGKRIRANQGHSLEVDLRLVAQTPPGELFHGTLAGNLPSIEKTGLEKRSRQHVHLSETVATAHMVATRRTGHGLVLRIDAAAMAANNHVFYRSANGVWLTDRVPREYISLFVAP